VAKPFTQFGGFVALQQNIRGNWPYARIRIEPGQVRVHCFTRKVGKVAFGSSVEIRQLNGRFWRFTEGAKDLAYWPGRGSDDAAVSQVAAALTQAGFSYIEIPESSEVDWGRVPSP
jgi:hypothetical protein